MTLEFYRPSRFARARFRLRSLAEGLEALLRDAFLFACAGIVAGATCAVILVLAAERAGLVRIAR